MFRLRSYFFPARRHEFKMPHARSGLDNFMLFRLKIFLKLCKIIRVSRWIWPLRKVFISKLSWKNNLTNNHWKKIEVKGKIGYGRFEPSRRDLKKVLLCWNACSVLFSQECSWAWNSCRQRLPPSRTGPRRWARPLWRACPCSPGTPSYAPSFREHFPSSFPSIAAFWCLKHKI